MQEVIQILSKKLYDSSKAKTPAKANTTFTVKAEKVPEKDSWLVVAAKPDNGSAQLRVLKLNSSSRPLLRLFHQL